jgi:TRAP-type C4-dicarboxylate transport system permease small subunit
MRRRSQPGAAIDRTAKALSFLGGLATLAMTGLIAFDVLMRYFLNEPQLFVDEVVGFLQVLVVFWGLAYTFQVRGHIRVDLVTNHLSGPVRAWARVFTLTTGIVIVAVLSWVTLESTLTAYRYGRVSTVMLYPLWPPMLLIPTGLALLAVVMLRALRRQLAAARGPRAARDEVPPTEAEPEP